MTRTASQVWMELADAAGGPCLLVFWNEHRIAQPLTPGGGVVIGRAPKCDVHVDDKSVSRRHARVLLHEGGFEIEDLGSANGTRVGGALLPPDASVPLEPGALVSLGIASLVVQPAAGAELWRTRAPASPAIESPWPDEEPMVRVAQLLCMAAAEDVPVLLLGEPGVGKSLAAELVHRASPRAARPLVRLDCAALGDGLSEAAGAGTLFLDEIGALAESAQAELLGALDAHDPCTVASTSRDLAELVADGRFRFDLFRRLAGVAVELPPLRQRVDEIEPLARRFLTDAAARLDRPAPELSEQALAALRVHAWPGNVRELERAMERSVLVCRAPALGPEHLMLAGVGRSGPPPAGDLRSELRALEHERLCAALAQTDGDPSAAARALGIGRRALIDRMAEHGLSSRRRGGPAS